MSGLVVDTSVWIEFLGGRDLPELEAALKEGRVILPPVVFSELLSGPTAGGQERKLLDLMEELDLHETPRPHWLAVGRLRRHCRNKGFRVSIPDAHVAQCALDVEGVLYSFDTVFQRISRIVPLKMIRE